jgi:hypothetical protein
VVGQRQPPGDRQPEALEGGEEGLRPGDGGDGGGAIEIGAVGNLTVGSIQAIGSGSGGGFSGGGAGGGILLHADGGWSLSSSLIAQGGGGNTGGGGGRIALVGFPAHTLGSALGLPTYNLSGGGGSLFPGYAGVLTLAANDTTVPSGTSVVLDGNPVLSVPGSHNQTTATIEAVIERNLTINSGGAVTLGKAEPLRSNSVVVVNGTLNSGAYSQTVADLTGSGTINLNQGGKLSVAGGTFAGTVAGSGMLSKVGGGSAAFSGSIGTGAIDVQDGALAVSGVINPFGDVLKTGPGALEIAGSLSPGSATSGIRVAEGTLDVTAAGSISAGVGSLSVDSGATFSVNGSTVSRPINAAPGSRVTATNATLGTGGANFVRIRGDLELGGITTLSSGSFVALGERTSLSGTLNAANGVSLGAGATFAGTGTVSAKTAAGFGSLIEAQGGDLSLGDATSVAGFFSDGELRTGVHALTINDKNEAVLGSLTTLGDGVNEGTLVAGTALPMETRTHFLIEQGKNLVGRGTVVGNVKNHGAVIGDGLLLDERIVFDAGWTVSGIGEFQNVLFNGTFAPGLSPGVVEGADLAVGGQLAIELGGPTPGNGPGRHDQVNDAGAFSIVDGATLALQSFGGYLPTPGQQFEIVTSTDPILGAFADVSVDPWFIAQGVGFSLEHSATALTAQAVAVSGDFNADGAVDGADLLAWQRSAGLSGANLVGDGDANGTVDASDLDIWKIQFAAANGETFSSAAAVPEPATWALALAATAAIRLRRRRARATASPRLAVAAIVSAALALGHSRPVAALVVPYGDTLRASSSDMEVINHGSIIGPGTASIEFGPETRLSGDGYFENTLVYGVFAPGNSPGISTGSNQAFGASANLQFELGGPLPGFGAGFHDQIRDLATIFLFGGPTLSVLPFGGYVPTVGQQFKIMTWQTGLVGSFGVMNVDSFFAAHGIAFTQVVTNPGGAGDLTLHAISVAVPEASAGLFASAAGLVALVTSSIGRGPTSWRRWLAERLGYDEPPSIIRPS